MSTASKSNTIPPKLADDARALVSLLDYYCAKSDLELCRRQTDALERVIIEQLPVDITSVLWNEKSLDINATPEACCREHCRFNALYHVISARDHPSTRLLINSEAGITGKCPQSNLSFKTLCIVLYAIEMKRHCVFLIRVLLSIPHSDREKRGLI